MSIIVDLYETFVERGTAKKKARGAAGAGDQDQYFVTKRRPHREASHRTAAALDGSPRREGSPRRTAIALKRYGSAWDFSDLLTGIVTTTSPDRSTFPDPLQRRFLEAQRQASRATLEVIHVSWYLHHTPFYSIAQGLFWRSRQGGVFRNDGSRLRRQKFFLLGRKAPVAAHPLAHPMGLEFSDEHLLTTQCDGDAASNRNRLLALFDGDHWRGRESDF